MLTASGLRFKTVLPGLTTSFSHTPPSQAVDLILFFLFPCPVKLPILLKISWMHFLSGLGMDDFTDLKFPPYSWVFNFFIELVHYKNAAWSLGCRNTTFFLKTKQGFAKTKSHIQNLPFSFGDSNRPSTFRSIGQVAAAYNLMNRDMGIMGDVPRTQLQNSEVNRKVIVGSLDRWRDEIRITGSFCDSLGMLVDCWINLGFFPGCKVNCDLVVSGLMNLMVYHPCLPKTTNV